MSLISPKITRFTQIDIEFFETASHEKGGTFSRASMDPGDYSLRPSELYKGCLLLDSSHIIPTIGEGVFIPYVHLGVFKNEY